MAKLQVQPSVAVIFGAGGKKPSKNAQKDNPTKQKPPMVGNANFGAPLAEAPSHEERLHNAAADEHVNAARDFVAGRISHKDYKERKARAASFMANTPKSKR
jgi:hypothetical protein